MLPAVPATPDRLPPMLFLAALFHAVLILGITFEAVPLGGNEATTLEVTIVADSNQHIEPSDDADYIAQANQRGSGNTTEQVRPVPGRGRCRPGPSRRRSRARVRWRPPRGRRTP